MRVNNCNLHKCLVFISCYLMMFVNVGLVFSIGTIFTDVMSTFNTSRAETAVIHSTAMAVAMGAGLIAGVIIHRFGIVISGILGGSVASVGVMACFFTTSTVYMTISFGIVFAFGLSCSHISSATSIGQHFQGRRKLLMLSLHSTGAAVGGMVYPYALAYWSDAYGFRGALLIIGGLSMNCIPGCLMWKQATTRVDNENTISERKRQRQLLKYSKNDDGCALEEIAKSSENDFDSKTEGNLLNHEDVETKEDTKREQTVLQSVKAVITNSHFMIFLIGCIAANPSVNIIIIFVADVFKDKGLSLNDATFALLLMNIINIFARLLPGAMMQSKRIPALVCPLLASLVTTLVLIGLTLSWSRGFTVGVSALAGMPLGMFVTMFSVMSAKLVEENNLPTAMGLLFSANGIGNAIAGPVNGYIRDVSGSYTVAFYSAAGMTAFSSMLFFVALLAHKLKRISRQ